MLLIKAGGGINYSVTWTETTWRLRLLVLGD